MKDSELVDAGRLLSDHRYVDAIRVCDRLIRKGEGVPPVRANRGLALLCLGRLDEALLGFREAAAAERNPKPDPGAYGDSIATVEWLRGCHAAAVEREEGYYSGMRACSGLRNPILECEWYLACYESDARGTKGPAGTR